MLIWYPLNTSTESKHIFFFVIVTQDSDIFYACIYLLFYLATGILGIHPCLAVVRRLAFASLL
jgi:hypothetical protein